MQIQEKKIERRAILLDAALITKQITLRSILLKDYSCRWRLTAYSGHERMGRCEV